MFRSPLDDSSSSDETEVEDDTISSHQSSTGVIETHPVATDSLSGNGDYSAADSQANEGQPQLRHHSDILLASLLEDFCRVRAAELLSRGSQSEIFTRDSPEVRPIAARMFAHNSRVLASNNMLPDYFSSEQMQLTRRQYLAGIDSIGLQALQDADMQGGRQIPENRHSAALRLLGPPASSSHEFANLLAAPLANLGVRGTNLYSAPSPYVDMQLSARGAPQLGRYHSEFSQVKLLGQGGFGQVFQVKNHVDSQNYAIKRIPVSAKVLRRWTEGGDQGTRMFHEIRTLAKVEHCNIVRYYGAWLESASGSQEDNTEIPRRSSADRRMIANRPALAALPNAARAGRRQEPSEEPSDGIVFGEDSISIAATKATFRDVPITSEPPNSTSTFSLPDSDIFSDGRSRSIIAIDSPLGMTSHVLCIQMSLHPISLTTYLSPAPDSKKPTSTSVTRHCYHFVPSLRLLLGIICGLQYLHALGIVHRDIKPGNILLSEPSSPVHYAAGYYDVGSCPSCPGRTPYFLNPRIADFGLVADIERSVESTESASERKTVGTEFYKGPSPSGTRAINDEKLDVFALGVVLFELVWKIGTRAERQDVLGDLSQRGRLPENFVEGIDPKNQGCGRRVAECIEGMVDRDSDSRWSCDQVKTWADRMLADLGSEAPGSSNSQSK